MSFIQLIISRGQGCDGFQDKMRIAVIVDSPARDLQACTLICAELSRNHDCYLISFSNASLEIFQLWPDLVLLNYIRSTNEGLINKLIQCGIAYSVLDTEGGVHMDIPNTNETTYTMTLTQDPRLRDNICQYFVWGELLYHNLIQRKIFQTHKIHCLGTPRMDFFSQPLVKSITNSLSINYLSRPMILINTSFAGNNPRYSTKAGEMNSLIKTFNYSVQFINTFFEGLDKALEGYIDLTLFLAKSFPEVDFIVRPHPFEDEKIYISKFENYPNIKVIQTGTSGEWLLKAKALIHFQCTTAIEAGFLNIPVFSLAEFDHVRPLKMVESISDASSSNLEMKEKILSVLNNSYQFPQSFHSNLKSIEPQLFYRVDGLAYQRIAAAINRAELEVKKNKKGITFLFSLIYSLYFGGRACMKYIYRGTLIPESKKINYSYLSAFILRLSEAKPGLSVCCKKLPFSNIYKISK